MFLAASPGTDVEPMWSTDASTPRSASTRDPGAGACCRRGPGGRPGQDGGGDVGRKPVGATSPLKAVRACEEDSEIVLGGDQCVEELVHAVKGRVRAVCDGEMRSRGGSRRSLRVVARGGSYRDAGQSGLQGPPIESLRIRAADGEHHERLMRRGRRHGGSIVALNKRGKGMKGMLSPAAARGRVEPAAHSRRTAPSPRGTRCARRSLIVITGSTQAMYGGSTAPASGGTIFHVIRSTVAVA